jgi:hypothetical protein
VKKLLGVAMALILLGVAVVPAPAVETQRGGFLGFIAGCCFGIRSGAAYNDGKDIHWREWCRLLPFAGIVFAIWDGVDGASGVTTADYVARYGAHYY